MTGKLNIHFYQIITRARRDYPAETAGYVFVDASKSHARHLVKAHLRDQGFTWAKDPKQRNDYLADLLDGSPGHAPQEKIVVYESQPQPADRVLKNDMNEAVAGFLHELGHVVTNPLHNGPAQQRESSADAFMALEGIKGGGLRVQDVAEISFCRAFNCVAKGDGDHFTSLALDKILADFTPERIAQLTPAEIKATAHHYGQQYLKPNAALTELADARAAYDSRGEIGLEMALEKMLAKDNILPDTRSLASTVLKGMKARGT